MKPYFKKLKSGKWLRGVFVSFLFLVGLLYLGFGYTKWQSQEIVAQVQEMTRVVQLPGNVTMELVYISPGSFLMGSPVNEAKRGWDETQHEVELTDGFWLGKYEVTQEQWQAIMGHNPSTFLGCRFPVGNVDWNEAVAFCEQLTHLEQSRGVALGEYTYTLPTEAQWEYACRAGTTTSLNNGYNLTYPWFSFAACPYLKEVGWSPLNNNGEIIHNVGLKKPNAWGLYDMHGNVSEWCLDCWTYGDYRPYKQNNPLRLFSKTEGKVQYKIRRGGASGPNSSLLRQEWSCRSASRGFSSIADRKPNKGFRVCLSTALHYLKSPREENGSSSEKSN